MTVTDKITEFLLADAEYHMRAEERAAAGVREREAVEKRNAAEKAVLDCFDDNCSHYFIHPGNAGALMIVGHGRVDVTPIEEIPKEIPAKAEPEMPF